MNRLNCFGACATNNSDNTIQLHKINEEANQIKTWLASMLIIIRDNELS